MEILSHLWQSVSMYWPGVRQVLFDWQTLIAGILALLGAFLTVRVIRAQISQAGNSEEARRKRDELAARAVLPLALSQFTRYARDCIMLLVIYVPGHGSRPPVPNNLALPTLSPDVIRSLQESARYAGPGVVSQIASLLSKFQVQQARMIELFSRTSQSPGQQVARIEGIQ
jgi:hypothetical protein